MPDIENSTIPFNRVEAILMRYGIQADGTATPQWISTSRLQKWTLLKAAFHKIIRRIFHKNTIDGQQEILKSYDAQWKKKAFSRYLPRISQDGAPWVCGNLKWTISNEGGAAIRLIYLEEALQHLKPASVLEVGAGNGINLLMLASRFPETQFFGVEPTTGGFQTAKSVIDAGQLPEQLLQFAPFPLNDLSAPARIRITQESSQKLSFDTASVDVVVTSLALEQMELIRHEALTEIARVAKEWVVMLEPFREVNSTGIRKAYVSTYGYFQGSIAELENYGLKVEKIYFDMPHKSILGTALVVARRIR